MTPLQYISMFITTTLLDIVVEQTNIYSLQTIHKSIDTNRAKIMSLIGMSIKMGIWQLPSYKPHWRWELRCPRIADVMHFVNNDDINALEKLVEIRLLISLVRDEFVKIEPEEYNSVEEQNKVFVYHTMQYEKAKKMGIQKSYSRWHHWFYVWLFRLWWEQICRARWWKIWSFKEMCASCCKAMRWYYWSQKL